MYGVKEMASTLISNLVTNSDRATATRKKKKKRSLSSRDQIRNTNNVNNQDSNNNHDNEDRSSTHWKSETQQRVYSSRLLNALRQARLTSVATPTPKRGRAVREVADRVLAVTAKGRTRWSRAILTNRLKLKFLKKNSKRQRSMAAARSGRFAKKPRMGILRLKKKNLPAVQKKVRVLSRLVPGCKKQPLPVILEEAADYIAAVQMQIGAMSALADFLSGAPSSANNQLGSSQPPPT